MCACVFDFQFISCVRFSLLTSSSSKSSSSALLVLHTDVFYIVCVRVRMCVRARLCGCVFLCGCVCVFVRECSILRLFLVSVSPFHRRQHRQAPNRIPVRCFSHHILRVAVCLCNINNDGAVLHRRKVEAALHWSAFIVVIGFSLLSYMCRRICRQLYTSTVEVAVFLTRSESSFHRASLHIQASRPNPPQHLR